MSSSKGRPVVPNTQRATGDISSTRGHADSCSFAQERTLPGCTVWALHRVSWRRKPWLMPLRPLGAELQVDMLITTTSAISGKLVFSDVRPKKKPYQQIASGKKKEKRKQTAQAGSGPHDTRLASPGGKRWTGRPWMIQNLRVLPLSAAVGGTFTHGKAIMLVSLSHIYI